MLFHQNYNYFFDEICYFMRNLYVVNEQMNTFYFNSAIFASCYYFIILSYISFKNFDKHRFILNLILFKSY